MNSEENNQNGGAAEEGAQEAQTTDTNEVRLTREEYDSLQKMKVEHGSFKRELKDLKKPKEEPQTSEQPKPEDSSLLKKAYLRASGLTDKEEQELALDKAKKWHDGDVEKLLEDPDWSATLEKHRTAKSNLAATTGAEGRPGVSNAKSTTEYWKSKGQPPTPEDVPDRKTRQKIVREMMTSSNKKGIRFYNE